MNKLTVIVHCLVVFGFVCVVAEDVQHAIPPEITSLSQTKPTQEEKSAIAKTEMKISDYVRSILKHYKQKDPIGLPVAPIPDPMSIPPLSHSFTIGKMNMQNVLLNGLSKFRIHHINVDLQAMQCEAALTIESLIVTGNYTLSTWLSRYNGPFTVKLKNVFVQAISRLEVEQNGQLEAQEMKMDITFKHIDMNFEGLGMFASMFQGIINSVGTFVFDSIKPFVLKEANTNLRKDMNEQVHKIPQNFTNSISPLDQILIEVRKKIRTMNYDPYKINDYNKTAGLLSVQMTNTWITGLSSIHRVGNITFGVRNNTVTVDIGVGTQKLEGSSAWEISLGAGMLSRAGLLVFTVEYLKVQVVVSQSLDTRNSPELEDIQLELGNIQVRCNGAGTLDYVVEAAVNVLPNILRYQIMDALESPIKMRVQEELNAINVEQLIEENLATLDEQQKNGFAGML